MPATFPIDYAVIRTSIARAMLGASGLQTYQVMMAEVEQPNAQRPPKPYYSFKIVNAAIRYGSDVESNIDPSMPGMFNYGGPRGMMISFNAYGRSHEEAYNYMALWQSALEQPATRAILEADGIAFANASDIRDLSQLLNTGYEGRAQMDGDFNIAFNSQSLNDTIEQVTVNGNILSSDGITAYTTTSTIGV